MENSSLEKQKFFKATDKLYTRLVNGLKNNTGKNGWEVLVDMKYIDFASCEDPDDFNSYERICPANIKVNGGTKYFQCICGKPHIKNLTLMEYKCDEWDYMIVGSNCIEGTYKFIKDIQDIDNLKEKMSIWIKEINTEKRKQKYKKCVSCGEYRVSKMTDYKNPARKYWCNNCCGGDCVNCIKCGRDRVFQYDWRGKPMLLCRPCYFAPSPSLSPPSV